MKEKFLYNFSNGGKMVFYKKYRFDLLLILLIIFFPIYKWFLMMSLSLRIGSKWALLTSLGQLTALLGTVLVALSMIFQIKLTKYFTFLAYPKTCQNIHHYAGVYGLIFLMMHPVFLAVRYLSISWLTSAKFLFSINSINLVGIIALIIMIFSMTVKIYLRHSFKFWKFFHQIMLVAYLGIIYHLLFVTSDISTNLVLKIYIFALIILGGFSFLIQKLQNYKKKPLTVETHNAL